MTKDFLLQKFGERKTRDLLFSLGIDGLGMTSYFVPALGEFADIAIAPITAALILVVHKSTKGAIFGGIEEMLPFTDIIPTATVLWIMRYMGNTTDTFKEFVQEAYSSEYEIDDFLKKLEE